MKLYTAKCTGDSKNTVYPDVVEIKSANDMRRAVAFDNMASMMANSYRHVDNFLQCDCVMFDIDNTHTDDPDEWVTEADIAETFPVNYVLVRSRNYMKPKRKVSRTGEVTIEEPREKWHVYAPLAKTITKAAEHSNLMKNILALFPFIDEAAIDCARFFYGVPHAVVSFEKTGECIDNYIFDQDTNALHQEQAQALQDYAAKVQNGTYKNNKSNQSTVKTICEFLRIRNPLVQDQQQGEQLDIHNLELGDLSWIETADQAQALQWLEDWAQQYNVELGRQYTINTAKHPNAVVICVACPWESEHSGGQWPDNEAVIIIEQTGKLAFLCRHGHGHALHWKDFRDYHEHKDMPAAATPEEPQTENPRPDNVLAYINGSMGDDIQHFTREIKTGFPNLDAEIGGLYPGLYAVGAISSLGKTTFVHQMADQIAAAGTDVLFFSMEQSRLELVSKSISRTLARKDKNSYVTSLSIRRGFLPQPVQDAAREYGQAVGEHLSIIEGNFNCTIGYIGDYVKKYIAQNGCKPVVVIDYLQILQPTVENGRRQTTKETVDMAVTELKRISRDHNITVIVISSLNRANYLVPVDFESFKESGGIEYTADCVLGLQLRCLNEKLFSENNKIKEKRERVKQAKSATPRKIELVCLKNRYGNPHFACGYEYFPAVDLFEGIDDSFGFDDAVEEPQNYNIHSLTI